MQHNGPISGVAAHDGLIATAGYDNQIILWDSVNSRPMARGYHDHLANQCSFSPDGKLLVTASSDYSARIWRVPDMKLVDVVTGHEDDVEMASFEPSGGRVATCSRDRTARIVDLKHRSAVVLRGHTDDVLSVCWAADGQRVVTSSDDGTVREWDAKDGRQVKLYELNGVQTDTIVLSRDLIFAGDDAGGITVLGDSAPQEVHAHDAGIKRLVYEPEIRKLASLSYDRKLMIWDVLPNGILSKSCEASIPAVVWARSAAFAGSNQLVVGSFGSTYATFDIPSNSWQTQGIEPYAGHNAVCGFKGALFTVGDSGTVLEDRRPVANMGSPCNFLLPLPTALLTGGQLGRLFNALTGKVVYEHHSPLNCAASFLMNGTPHLIVGTYTGDGLIFSHESDEPRLVRIAKLHDNAVKGVAVANGRIFSVCASGAAAFHDARTHACLQHFPRAHSRIANGCAVAGDVFLSVGRDLKLRTWGETGEHCIDTPHRNSIKCIATSSDGQRVLTGSYTGLVAEYDLSRRAWSSYRPTASGISSVCYRTDRNGVEWAVAAIHRT